ncbi:MAG: chemotaxis-specific protein-glutamate methyltransferase CheB [Symploca sp. SIO3C6]|uniref:Protein-glutamate methylesterase/protein-glutamine glutaminase n=1 Tax=Symploca sp. SIO1C4 TaxID=2607765 RepID=A0A6B3NCN2_9CYAN|nr:chemotaxis-specific protein-glutamate methyltransferase CheB [Symploca sp. SIO3C6]NER27814.1 chemotaxis-specific protein-glutamate methyltransferase CheB [Symploca sp. SIO1C4]NET04223.1 chemotaxis-specific protein-glutamate methyltransferase CheB [Symploca sp. SIO2B6]
MSIRVLLVEDSLLALVILKRILNLSEEIEVVGEARTGLEALKLIPEVEPDVICTDFHMPQMDGLQLTTEVMTRYPKPILVISVSVLENDTDHIFELLEAGAVDILPKPPTGLATDNEFFRQELINKIIILSGVKVFKRKRRFISKSEQQWQIDSTTVHNQIDRLIKIGNTAAFSSDFFPKPKVVVIGASTGGPQAIQELLAQLPSDFPVPVICVQHICIGFLQGFIDWLNKSCSLQIQIAQPGNVPKPKIIYFPPEKQHLELDSRGQFIYSEKPPVDGHCPSVTTLFESVAKFYGKKTVGILLTGMGRDGAKGMQVIAEAGGFTIAQDEATSIVFGMPKEAIQLGAAKQVLPISAIAPMLLNLVYKQTSTLS